MTSFEEYTDQYGMHFNKKLYEWAVSKMTDRNGNPLPPKTKEQVAEMIRAYGFLPENNMGHDVAYVYQMAKADYYGSSITNDSQLALYVRDYLDDPDGYPEKAFDHFVIDCRSKGVPIFWDEMM